MSKIWFKQWRRLLLIEPVSVGHVVKFQRGLPRSSIGTAEPATLVIEDVSPSKQSNGGRGYVHVYTVDVSQNFTLDNRRRDENYVAKTNSQ